MGVLVSLLKSNGGEIRGRTAIQKLAYFAHCKFPDLAIPKYAPYYYGPFSAGLGQMLARLVSLGFVNETRIVGGYVGYAYALNDDGEKLSDNARNKHEQEFADIRKLVSDCKQECELDIPVLSAASKIHYLVNKDGPMELDEAVKHAKGLKWIIREENATKGEVLLRKLGLVE